MFMLGTLGLGVLYLLASLMFVLAVGSLYGTTAAMWTAAVCAVLGLFAGVMIGALLAGGFKHPLQAQLEDVVHEASSRRRAGGSRYSARGDSPYAREKDAPTYGDQGVPVAAGGPHDHMSSWQPQAVAPAPSPPAAYEAPSFQVPVSASAGVNPPPPEGIGPAGGLQAAGRSAIRRAKGLREQVPLAQMQQRLQTGDVDGAVELGRQAVEKELGAAYLDEVYEALPSLLATYRSGGGRATLGQLAERTRQATVEATGQTKADAEMVTAFLERLQTASPSDVSPKEWLRILGSVGQARSNPRAFLQVVSEALQPPTA